MSAQFDPARYLRSDQESCGKVALVLAQAPVLVTREINELERRGYEVRYFRKAAEALTLFGNAMPTVAIIGPVSQTPALDLLIEDLAMYGVPVALSPRHSVERMAPHLAH
jgi:hypothetical protein